MWVSNGQEKKERPEIVDGNRQRFSSERPSTAASGAASALSTDGPSANVPPTLVAWRAAFAPAHYPLSPRRKEIPGRRRLCQSVLGWALCQDEIRLFLPGLRSRPCPFPSLHCPLPSSGSSASPSLGRLLNSSLSSSPSPPPLVQDAIPFLVPFSHQHIHLIDPADPLGLTPSAS